MVDQLMSMNMCYQTVIGDPDTVSDMLSFYKLVAAWLLRTACGGAPLQLPLPEPAPMEFATLPVRIPVPCTRRVEEQL